MAAQPRIKLDKKEVKKGDIVEVKALVSHVMETGLRKDNDGNLVPRKILNKFVCLVAGKQVFAANGCAVDRTSAATEGRGARQVSAPRVPVPAGR